MRGTPAENNVRAKTGSLTGVSALSGYVSTADNELVAFSILCNHFPAGGRYLREVQDSVMVLLAKSIVKGG
jgi:D-alanyl-D-alanine carboxypeptidase/D-alanyl-D-alanine-endopeptidase (penicillin-binding protein 4)